MSKTILFTFDNEDKRNQFITLMRQASSLLIKEENFKNFESIIKAALDTAKYDPSIKLDTERTVAIFVSGQKITEGSLPNMRRYFDQEVASHSANVELRELNNGTWKTIQSRKLPK